MKTFHFKRFVLGGSVYKIHSAKPEANPKEVVVSRVMVCTAHPFDFDGERFVMDWPIRHFDCTFFKLLIK